ncbi:MAG: elongation factor G, partial [Lachnospiraceae bacterium]|nr:elongation factor G [Lachnospiraceae bacterium]
MNVYTTSKVRNVVLLGHGGCGKTTLTEAMAYVSGLVNRQGRVEDGNTVSDYDKEEAKRLFSIHTSVVPLEWENTKINILDTPGYFDFVGEVEEAVSVADAAVIVVSGKNGVEVGTIKAWELCEKYNIPRMMFVTDMDLDHASFRQALQDMNDTFGKKIAPFHLPIRENEKFVGFVNVVKMEGRRFIDVTKYEDFEIPDYSMENLKIARETLLEAVAETSEEYMERYFAGDEFTADEILGAIRAHVRDGGMVPVLIGSGLTGIGARMLLQGLVHYLPSPAERTVAGLDLRTNEIFQADYKEDKTFSAKIFKTIADPFIGRYSLIKVCSGVLKPDMMIYNYDKDTEEKISKVYIMQGKTPVEVKELHAGDIGAVAKLSNSVTGDTLSTKAKPITYGRPDISVPYNYMRYKAKNKGDEDKISGALAKLMDEDLTLKAVNDAENRQSLLYGIGDQQLEVAVSMLLNRYKVEIELSKPKVAFRETIRGKVKVQGKHKKQSGGHGQYGDVHMEFEPSGDLEQAYVFDEKVFGGAVPKNFFPAVEKGIQESTQKGPLAAYPVVGVKATLVDGSYHPVDSSEMAFKTAAKIAFKKGFLEAKPVLLEPIVSLKVTAPDKFTGDIMGDLNKRRGRVLGMNPDHKGNQVIEADVPMAEIIGYSTDLRSMTGGMGDYSYTFSRYEQAPSDVQEKEIKERA